MTINIHGISAIYRFEMARWFRTLGGSLLTPVLTTSLYFVVFGAAIGSRMGELGGVSYGAFIVPGLIMLTVLTESTNNSAFGIYIPKWSGTIYELLSAPVSSLEAVAGYVGAAMTKSILIGLVILATARLFVPFDIEHPFLMLAFLALTAFGFCTLGFCIGVWAETWERLNIVPSLILTPLTFLGGTFYSISMLPPFWQTASLFNPVAYIIDGFRWCFYGTADINPALSFSLVALLGLVCLGMIWWIFRTGWRLKA